MAYNQPITLRVEELVAQIIKTCNPATRDIVIEGSDQVELPHPVYISVTIPEGSGASPQLARGPIYNVEVDVIRMAYYNHQTHEERKVAVGKIQGIFKLPPPVWAEPSPQNEGVYLRGWYIESIGSDDSGDYVGDGMRIVCAVQET